MRDNNSQIQTLLLIIWRRHNILFEWSLANCNWDDRFKTCGTETDFICVFVYLCICVFAFVCLWFQRILLYKYRANVVCARGRDGSFKTSGIFEHRLSDNSAKSELTHLFVNASLFLVTQTFKQYLLVAKTQTPTLIQSTIVKHKSVSISWSMKLSSKTAGNSNSWFPWNIFCLPKAQTSNIGSQGLIQSTCLSKPPNATMFWSMPPLPMSWSTHQTVVNQTVKLTKVWVTKNLFLMPLNVT